MKFITHYSLESKPYSFLTSKQTKEKKGNIEVKSTEL